MRQASRPKKARKSGASGGTLDRTRTDDLFLTMEVQGRSSDPSTGRRIPRQRSRSSLIDSLNPPRSAARRVQGSRQSMGRAGRGARPSIRARAPRRRRPVRADRGGRRERPARAGAHALARHPGPSLVKWEPRSPDRAVRVPPRLPLAGAARSLFGGFCGLRRPWPVRPGMTRIAVAPEASVGVRSDSPYGGGRIRTFAGRAMRSTAASL